MGVVYKAEDTKLKREVAIKFLPRQIAVSDEERERFKLEAQAAAALNHNNIATVYEIHELEGEEFIVMEFIKGESLREKIAKGPLKLDEAVRIATEVADGLHEAHEHKIVHRDIKPANIMLTAKGQCKIMDFGLAKMAQATLVTKEGTTLGTAAYMSPEQARGEKVDRRTDIFSLGVMLYEMLTGQLPFKGDYEQAITYSILNEDQEPITALRSGIPMEFERVVNKCLQKEPSARYQHADELLVDLQALQKTSESGLSSTQTTAVGTGFKPASTRKLPFLVGSLAVLALLVVAVWKAFMVTQEDARPFQNMQISRLTRTGKSGFATISPDGNYVVHVLHDRGQSSLWVRQVATASNVQIVLPADVTFKGTTFSPDGNYIYYVMSDKVTLVSTLYRIPTLGGNPKKILSNIASSVALSPDGQQIAFVRQFSSQGEESLMLANADGSALRKLTSRKEPEFFVNEKYVGPSWSPDGSLIACGAGIVSSEWRMGVLLVSVEDGTQAWLLKPKRGFKTNRVVWTPDGKGLVFNAVDTTSQSRYQLWYVTYPEAELHRVTNDLNSYETASLGLTTDGGTLVTVKVERTSNIWTIPDLDASRAVQLSFTAGTDEGILGVSFTANGQIAYCSLESGNPDIWIMDQSRHHLLQ